MLLSKIALSAVAERRPKGLASVAQKYSGHDIYKAEVRRKPVVADEQNPSKPLTLEKAK